MMKERLRGMGLELGAAYRLAIVRQAWNTLIEQWCPMIISSCPLVHAKTY